MESLGQGLAWGFSNREDGNMSLFYGESNNSLGNREKFLRTLGIDYKDLVCAKQIHSNQIRYVSDSDKGKGALSYDTALADTDALITNKKGLPLAIFTADCLSIFLYAETIPALGLVHAGREGTRENIVSETIIQMQKRFNLKAEDLKACFGPAIRSCCYEVGRDFKDFGYGLIKRDSRYYIDLIEANKKQILDRGIKKENIRVCGICTSCENDRFFSFRKEGRSSGRMISAAMLK
ncbi:MAG: peptidoglycan editing factor PgeF [Candidatus Omnitrophota bacterium]|nr:MAG: peptidoglycan editing factor PgeF [Candidatus Omnitrophota bacterium]